MSFDRNTKKKKKESKNKNMKTDVNKYTSLELLLDF